MKRFALGIIAICLSSPTWAQISGEECLANIESAVIAHVAEGNNPGQPVIGCERDKGEFTMFVVSNCPGNKGLSLNVSKTGMSCTIEDFTIPGALLGSCSPATGTAQSDDLIDAKAYRTAKRGLSRMCRNFLRKGVTFD